jgi:WD40 repeat protein
VWQEAGQSLHLLWQAHTDVVLALTFSPDGGSLLSARWDGCIKRWDLHDGRLLWTGWHTKSVRALACTPDGDLLASGTYLHGVLVWEVTTQRTRWIGRELLTWIRCVAWSPDGTRLVGGGDDGSLYLWDASDGTLLARLAGQHGGITIWNLHSGQYMRTLRRDRPYERLNITGIRGLTQAQKATLRALGAREG